MNALDAPTRAELTTRSNPIPVRLKAWGATEADVERAISEASWGWGRQTWEFVAIERHIGAPCPLPKYDPKSLASGAGFDWAFVAYVHKGDR